MLPNLSAENCGYRGEGNAGLVIYLKKEEKVLRLIKQDVESQTSINQEDQLQRLQNQISMVKNVMKPLLGENLVNCPAIVFLHSEDIKMLNNLFSTKRPDFRKHKHVKEEDSYALVLPDYCTLPPDLKVLPSTGPVITVEIKPKQGYLSKNEFLPTTLPSNSFLKCRFCMTQHYKLKKNMITSKSAYCPTDLFSGCPTRMHHALKMLIETPQNNLRIFKNQELIYSEENRRDPEETLQDFFGKDEISCTDALCKLIVKILLKTFTQTVDERVCLFQKENLQSCTNVYPSCTQDGICHKLPLGCVLYRILCIQMLDQLHIQNLHSHFLKIMESDARPSDHDDCLPIFSIPPHFGKEERMPEETDVQYSLRKVWEFLVALTARDCSIMLVLKNYSDRYSSNHSQNLVENDDGKLYLFSIAIADLDAKPVSKVERHFKDMPFLIQSCLSQSV
ncbi:hypothetical protein JTE90_028902 [Oedothorax gibbosus]|uniref:Inositol-pentakisphosphate 2-kinase n=1 Tax=Oedothorax gibbosus TaxID=931172 RepID=A0AAV6UN83_9ARAC|nr:hypothetical protein JTE90_028902 [Oedothorax gibbosus]